MTAEMTHKDIMQLAESWKSIDRRLSRIETAIAGDDSHDVLGYRQRVKKIEVWKNVLENDTIPDIDRRINKIYYTAAGIGATVAVIGTFVGQILLKVLFG